MFCTAGPHHFASPEQTSNDELHPSRLGLGITVEMLTSVPHSREGQRSFGKGCVQLQILRVNSLPCPCCTGALSVKYRGHCFSPKPHHESVVAPRKALCFLLARLSGFIPDSPLIPTPGAARPPASPCCGFIFSRC